MNVLRAFLASVLLASGLVAASGSPVAAASPSALGGAISDGVTATGASFDISASDAATEVMSNAFGPFGTTSYAVIGTGRASDIFTANTSGSLTTSYDSAPQRGDSAFDVTILRLDFEVPASANCLLGVDFQFFSDEYPEFVGSAFNDAFIIELDESTWTTSGDSINAPGNIAFDPIGNPITINAAGLTSMTADNAAGTTYDGATPALRAGSPLSPGSHSIFFSIFDTGDSAYDSAVIIDNIQIGAVDDPEDCKPGATPIGEKRSFVVLGDSYAAGEGSGDYDPDSDETQDCHRTPNAWGRLLATSHDGLTVLGHIACSGARIEHFEKSFTDDSRDELPQLDQYEALISAVENDPDFALVVIGGNDLRFARLALKCFVDNSIYPGPCTNAIEAQIRRVDKVAERIADDVLIPMGRMAPDTVPILVGYPRILPDDWNEVDTDTCSWLSKDEWELLNKLTQEIHNAWADAAFNQADEVGARFIGTLEVLDEHEMCSKNVLTTWMFPLTGERPNKNQQQVHPNALGQAAMEAKIYQSLVNIGFA